MPKNVRVVPAILTDEPKALEKMIRQSEAFTDFVQIDFMDGKFVPSHSVSPDSVRSSIHTKMKWEAHLMIREPAKHFANLKLAGAFKVIFHYEAVKSPELVIAAAQKFGLKVGIAINPETGVAAVLPLAGKVDSVLLLAVHPGFYGAKFLPEVLQKIPGLVAAGFTVGIDGGIKETNIEEVARTGVTSINVGSAVYRHADPAAAFRKLQSMVDAA